MACAFLSLSGCIRTEDWTTTERDADSETSCQNPPLAAGVGGYQCPAQKTHRTAPGSPGLPGAGFGKPPCSNETKLIPVKRPIILFGLFQCPHHELCRTICTINPCWIFCQWCFLYVLYMNEAIYFSLAMTPAESPQFIKLLFWSYKEC